ncbi:hypothetical protein ZHS_71 [Edwardsiella phage vB_EpM_ZHS]|nr:hypothetical protein ZHS_71 [Edwardsiella phage vB_EpM_ZHS]
MARVFDWEKLLRERRIPYAESGANIKRGEIGIRCPFCGTADPSMHMGLSRETGWYSCWRNRRQHSGKSPLRLIMKLLGVPYGMAREIAGLGDDYVDPEGFDAIAAAFMGRMGGTGRKEEVQRRKLHLDPGFRIVEPRGRTRRHFEYLVDERGFDRAGDVDKLGRLYGICAGVEDVWSHRVILPYYLDGLLVTWTGRAIGEAKIRYRDLEVEESILPPKATLYNHDAISSGGKALVLQEGPFDALKVDFYGRRFGVRSTALSTNSIQDAQAFLLQEASDKFERVVVMMDNADRLAVMDSMRMQQDLAFLPNVTVAAVPFGSKDGGALSPDEVEEWAQAL